MNFFVKVKLLTGEKRVFQLPNDLKDGIAELTDLNAFFKGALITIPLEKYGKETMPKLSVGKVMSAFTMDKNQYWRTRGQFLTSDAWRSKLSKEQVKFILHDHSFMNKVRILFALIKWKRREKS